MSCHGRVMIVIFMELLVLFSIMLLELNQLVDQSVRCGVDFRLF